MPTAPSPSGTAAPAWTRSPRTTSSAEPASGAGNVISANGTGVSLSFADTTGNQIQGNYIGTDASGALDLGNANSGVELQAPDNVVGGTTPGARNVISGNGGNGVWLFGSGTTGNQIQGNLIGTNASGAAAVPNSSTGVRLERAPGNDIGGTAAAAGNVISGNTGGGVLVIQDTAIENRILGNSIHTNSGLGINLANDGVTLNDLDDPDTGPNIRQNFPVLTSAVSGGGQTEVAGHLNSEASKVYQLEFFSSPSCDSSGNGEGAQFLGSASVTTDAGGDVSFSRTVPVAAPRGHVVTATATDPAGSTSEFSSCITATPPTRLAGVKFDDLNGDGDRDAGEPGLRDWTIRAYSDDGDGSLEPGETNQVAAATTSSTGAYQLDLDPGDYVVCEVRQNNWTQTAPAPTDNECGDTVSGLGDGGHPATLSAGQILTGRDFGNRVIPAPRITGAKFNDVDGDGERGAGEPGLGGWEIRAYEDANQNGALDPGETTPAADTETNSDGTYELNLDPGDYVICEVAQIDWEQTAPAPSDQECAVGAAGGVEDGGHAVSIATGQTLTDRDFGNHRDATRISGIKFNDQNGDGLKAGDPGLEGWTIRAYADDGDGSLEPGETNQVAAATTAASTGAYTLTVPGGGDYVVCELAQGTWTQTAPAPADNECGDTVSGLGDGGHAVSIATGQTLTDRDFGNHRDATRISGIKFNDQNGDGLKAGDPGLEGWTIRAYADDGDGSLEPGETNQVAAATTAASTGAYTLTVPGGGDYVVCELAQGTWTQTAPAPADNECGDTVSGLGDGGHAVSIATGQTLTDRDFGNHRDATRISGIKFNDQNGDGLKAGDPGLEGWTIRAYADDGDGSLEPGETNQVAAATTAASTGAYTLTVPGGGDYVVCELAQGTWTQTAPAPADNECGDTVSGLGDGGHAVSIATGQTLTDRDFGNHRDATRISGIKFNDQNGDGLKAGDPGLEGWTIRAYADDGDGSLEPGETNQVAAATTAASTGAYTLTVPGGGDYVVCELAQGTWTQTAPAPADNECGDTVSGLGDGGHAVSIATGQTLTDRDFGNHRDATRISGIKFNDQNGDGLKAGDPGLEGWTIRAYADDGDGSLEPGETNQVAAATTAASTGAYTLTVPGGGDYVVCELAQGTWTQTAPAPADNECGDTVSGLGDGGHAVSIATGQTLTDRDFGNHRDATRISGIKFNDQNGDGLKAGDPGLEGWTIRAYADDGDGSLEPGETNQVAAATTAASTGAYTLTVPGGGDYVVCELAQGTWTQTAPAPADNECGDTVSGLGDGGHAVSIATGQTLTDRDFGNHRDATRISGIKFNDQNGDGLKAGDPGLEGWTIRAYADDGDGSLEPGETNQVAAATTAASTGAYTLTVPGGGDYVVCELAQGTWTQTAPAPADNECGDTVSGLGDGGHAVSIATGQTLTDRDFGNHRDATRISGIKFNDQNGDGLKAGDPGLEGWTIRAYADDGDGSLEPGETNQVAAATTAASTGAYTLTVPGGGDYVVCELAQGTWTQTAPAPADNECGDTVSGLGDGGHAVSIATGQTLTDRDFGNHRDATRISGIKFNDQNGDGLKAGDPGLEGWTIRAYADDGDGSLEPGETNQVAAATTAASTGAYTLTVPGGGDYVVCELAQGTWTQTAPAPADNECGDTVSGLGDGGHAVSIATGQTLTDRDFGNHRDATRISGIKFNDQNGDGLKAGDPGLEGWTIRAYADDGDGSLEPGETNQVAAATTAASTGAYTLTVPGGGDYVVCELAQGTWTQTAPAPADNECGDTVSGLGDGGHAVSIATGQTLTDRDFGNRLVPVTPPTLIKDQRLVKPSGSPPPFTEKQIAIQLGDTVEYRLRIGTGSGGSFTVLDRLPNRLQLIPSSLDPRCQQTAPGVKCTLTNTTPATTVPITFKVRFVRPDCDVIGTPSADVLTGTSALGQVICGGGAGDKVTALGGNDVVYGDQPTSPAPSTSPIDNTAWVDLDSDGQVDGSEPSDGVRAVPGPSTDGGDTIVGGPGADEVWGQGGNDVVNGNTGADIINGQLGDDTLRGDETGDTVRGNEGKDTLTGNDSADTLSGNDGDDTLSGNDGGDTLSGNEGNDTLSGNEDGDTISGNENSDTLSGDEGSDSVFGNDANDLLEGGGSRDLLSGGEESDQLFGGGDNDALLGGDNKDRLAGGSGKFWNETADTSADLLIGGDGPDLLLGQGGADSDTASDFTAGGSSWTPQLQGGLGVDSIHGGPGNDRLDGGPGGGADLKQNVNNILYGADGGSDFCSNGPLEASQYGGTDRGDIRDPTCELPATGQSTKVSLSGSTWTFRSVKINVSSVFSWDNF